MRIARVVAINSGSSKLLRANLAVFLIDRIFGNGSALVPSTGRFKISGFPNLIIQLISRTLFHNETNSRAERMPHALESRVAVPKLR